MRPFDDLRGELDRAGDELANQPVRSDDGRLDRTGTPEVIYAARKSIEQVLAGIDGLMGKRGRVVVSQIPGEMVAALRDQICADWVVSCAPGERAAVIALQGSGPPTTGGRVAVISAG